MLRCDARFLHRAPPHLPSPRSAAYFCTVERVELGTTDGRPSITLDFTVVSDMSLGPFQRPASSRVRTAAGAACPLLREDIASESGMKIEGRLVFARGNGMAGPFYFEYGEVGYSSVRLPDVQEVA